MHSEYSALESSQDRAPTPIHGKPSSTKPVLDAKDVGDRCPRGLTLGKCSADVRGWGGGLSELTEHCHLSTWRSAHKAEPTKDTSTTRLLVVPEVPGMAPAPPAHLCWRRTKLSLNTGTRQPFSLNSVFPLLKATPRSGRRNGGSERGRHSSL